MAEKIKIGIIGCGGIWLWGHSPEFEKLDDFEIVAVCDIKIEKAKAAAELVGISEDFAFENYEDLLKVEGLQAIDICTPNYLHSVIAVKALNAGIHVFCEKPDAVSVEEAVKMKEASEKNNKLLMVMRNNRFRPSSTFLKKYIEDGKLGDIYTARCGWRRRRGIPGKGGWFTNKTQSGGGPLIDLGVHMIDLSMWLMGNPKPVAVSGCTYTKFAEDTSQADSEHSAYGEKLTDGVFDVEDMAFGFIRFENGASMQIEFSWASNIEKEIFFVDLRGDKAGAYIRANDDTLKIFGEENGTTFDLQPHVKGNEFSNHGRNLKNFADVLNKKAEPIYTPEQGVDMINILEAMYRSAKEGREIRI